MGMTHEQEPSAALSEPFIKLDQFLKWQGAVESGGVAKMRITSGDVKVNGEVETRRGRKLREGDLVSIDDEQLTVHLGESAQPE